MSNKLYEKINDQASLCMDHTNHNIPDFSAPGVGFDDVASSSKLRSVKVCPL